MTDMIPVNAEGIRVYETNGGDPIYRQKLLDFYPELFPEYGYYLPYMEYRMTLPVDSDPLFIERWWLIEVEGQVAGLRLFKYSPSRNCALVLGTSIKSEFRKYPVAGYDRLSSYIVSLTAEQIMVDARAARRPIPVGLVSEVQLPEPHMTAEEAAYHIHIADRYHDMGYVDLPVEYYEPPHIVGKESYLQGVALEDLPYNHMVLSVRPIEGGGFDPHDQQMMTDCTLAYLTDHYKLPSDHWIVTRALESIERQAALQDIS
jgi:hypothetical protein